MRHLEITRGGRLLFVSLLLLLLLSLVSKVIARPPRGDTGAFSLSSSSWEGYSEFVRLAQRRLGTRRVTPQAHLDYNQLRADDALIIVRPTTPLDDVSLSAFLSDGGRVALLDDFGRGDVLLQKFGIARISPPANPAQRLRNNADFAVAVPSVQMVAGVERGRHPIVAAVETVVTNHPLALQHPSLTPVLEIRDKDGSALPIAITGVIAKSGRLFALSDPSIFINSMLRYPGNRELAEGLLRYLAQASNDVTAPRVQSADSSENHPAKIWILANDFEQSGHYGQEEAFLKRLKNALSVLKKVATSIDDHGLPASIATFLAAILALWALSTQLKQNLRFPVLRVPGFAQPPLLAAQSGLGARAKVLSSDETNPVLALMEVDAALRETICRRLHFNPGLLSKELGARLEKAGLAPKDAQQLSSLLQKLRSIGQSLGTGRTHRTTETEMKRVHQDSLRLLREIEALGSRHEH